MNICPTQLSILQRHCQQQLSKVKKSYKNWIFLFSVKTKFRCCYWKCEHSRLATILTAKRDICIMLYNFLSRPKYTKLQFEQITGKQRQGTDIRKRPLPVILGFSWMIVLFFKLVSCISRVSKVDSSRIVNQYSATPF